MPIQSVNEFIEAVGGSQAAETSPSQPDLDPDALREEDPLWGPPASLEAQDVMSREPAIHMAGDKFAAFLDDPDVDGMIKQAFLGTALRMGGKALWGAGKGLLGGARMAGKATGAAAKGGWRLGQRSRQAFANRGMRKAVDEVGEAAAPALVRKRKMMAGAGLAAEGGLTGALTLGTFGGKGAQ